MGATVTEVELFVRPTESDMPWASARVTRRRRSRAGALRRKDRRKSRTPRKTKQVCEVFSNWSSERARAARMLVRYSPVSL